MKKFTMLLCVCLILGLALTACDHPHDFTEWSMNAHNHWYICSCGAQVDTAAHELDDENFCTVCHAAVYEEDDGTFSVLTYDEQGTMNSFIVYEESGIIVSHQQHISEYYEDGNPRYTQWSLDGILQNESFYEPCENPEYGVFLQKSIDYMEDGSQVITVYAEDFIIESVTTLDADGNEVEVTSYEYEYDETGNQIYMAAYTNDIISQETMSSLGDDGNMYDTAIIFYDEYGVITDENTYTHAFDENGNLTCITTYYNGVRTTVSTFALDADGWLYQSTEIEYDANGDVVVEYHYDSEGNIIE